ncbi:DUF1146 family protein [Mycoplasma sp. SG1]|uniref:DUF1146 family protein n=1 Tax=Mycoplasma sp. SG1 TaxID=2810348 RepID=UPI0020258D02|nr:DUF1146 family protein [Mycoplasma sp. SG1]URM52976.1 DUF1146 family protein [Mycoplasma sp. SG1]
MMLDPSTKYIITVIVMLICFALSFYLVYQLDLEQKVKVKNKYVLLLIYLFFSLAVGYLSSMFLLTLFSIR